MKKYGMPISFPEPIGPRSSFPIVLLESEEFIQLQFELGLLIKATSLLSSDAIKFFSELVYKILEIFVFFHTPFKKMVKDGV